MLNRRGIALISVLLVAIVLSMLATALVSMNRSGFLSLNQYEQRTRALQACYAGLDYARGRLAEGDGSWGRQPFGSPTRPVDVPQTRVQESGATLALNRVQGSLLQEDSQFELRVFNNLSNRFSAPAPEWSRCQVEVPARTAFLAIDGICQGVPRHLEVLVNRRVGLGVGVFAGRDLAISLAPGATSKVLTFSSNMPRGNQVKVNHNVLLPEANLLDFGTLAARGKLQSGDDTVVGTDISFDADKNATSSGGTGLMNNQPATQAASDEVKASITTGTPPSPPKFQPGDLKTPATAAGVLDPGTYTFTSHETVVHRRGSVTRSYTGTIPLDNGASVRLGEYRFMPQGNVEVTGNVTLEGQQTRLRLDGTRMVAGAVVPMPVSLGVGYGGKGLPLANDLLGTTMTTTSRFTVKGDLIIKGDLVGSGQLFVQKDSGDGGKLTLEGNSQLSATRTDGMAVVAEDSVHFQDVNSLARIQPFAMGTNEFPLYQTAVQAGGPSGPGLSQTQMDILASWQGQTVANITSVVGDSDYPGPYLRGQVLPGYADTMRASPEGLTATPQGTDLANLQLVLPGPPDANGNPTSNIVTASQMLDDFLRNANETGGVTLGKHTRIREFLKSVDRGAPNPALISVFSPGLAIPGLNSAGFEDATYESYNPSIFTMVANQVSAYNQDARLHGSGLLAFLGGPNPYSDGQRFDFIFGGILYAQKNIYAHIANRFNLLGSMISSDGTVGFDHLRGGRVVYDPTSFEEQFDLSKVGLSVNFFWMAP